MTDPSNTLPVRAVLCWGTYDNSKPRTRILRQGLRLAGVTVLECHKEVWAGVQDKSMLVGVIARLRVLFRWVSSYPGLLWRFLRTARPDVLLVGYPGVLDVIMLWPFARIRRVPIVWDMFISLYDTVVNDRCLLRPQSWAARMLRSIENLAIRLADVVFLDTSAHARYVEKIYALPPHRCSSVWVGVESEFLRSRESVADQHTRSGDLLKVLFYGQFIPLHGIDVIIAAARAMRDEPVEWLIVGRGQEAARVRSMVEEAPLPALRWVEWMEYQALRDAIAWADVCLGIFGTSEKAACVIPNKVFQVLAAGRPLITRDSPGIRELLRDGPPCVQLVQAGDPYALVAALRRTTRPTAPRSPPPCHGDIVQRIEPTAIGQQFLDVLRRAHIGRAST